MFLCREALRDELAHRMRPSHGRIKICENGFFENKTIGPAFGCRPPISLFFMHRQDNDLDVGAPSFDPARRFQAVQPGHGDVHEDNFRPELVIETQRLFAVFRLTDEVKVAFFFRQPSYGFTETGIIIYEQYIYRHDKSGINGGAEYNNQVNTEV